MGVSMMHVGKVGVRVDQRRMNVGVRMRLAAIPRFVCMLVVFVVGVGMAVLQILVHVSMCVPLADM